MEVFSVCVRMIVVTVNYCIFDMLEGVKFSVSMGKILL